MSELSEALSAYKADHGHMARKEMLERVAGVSTQSDIPADKVQAVLAECNGWTVPTAKAKAKPSFTDPAFIRSCYDRFNNSPARSE